jgi:hypothetical protein
LAELRDEQAATSTLPAAENPLDGGPLRLAASLRQR